MERLGLSRSLVTIIIVFGFFLFAALAIVLLAPLVETQVIAFVRRVPGYVQQLIERGEPLWRTAKAYLSAKDIDHLRSAGSEYAGTLVSWLGIFFSRLLTGSLVVVNVLSLIFITPVVTFYLLRDWDGVTKRVDAWLPRNHAATIRQQLGEIDVILASFVRGQALVCLILGSITPSGSRSSDSTWGWWSVLPPGSSRSYPISGTISGFLVGTALALAQSQDWMLVAMVAGVFLVGNLLEGYVLAPKLVGEKIGLHPVWVIFALLAGGALFGFLGILLALPVAAVIGVLARFALARYMLSSLYYGDDNSEGTAP